jgi:cyanophycin synthetase
VRLVEVRLLDGPNVYLLGPAVRLEIAIGRRRSWSGQRSPGRHSIVHLGATVRQSDAPAQIAATARWVRRLHTLALGQRGVAPRIHRTSEPGHWVVTFPWHEGGRAEAIARAAFRLVERRADPRATTPPPAQLLRAIRDADTRPPSWITDEERRIPSVSISGTNGKSTTTRMIGHILRSAGRHVGMTTSDGVIVDDETVEEGDLTGPLGAQRVLLDESVDVAVLETARGGILLRGLGFQSSDAAVLTNISPDHLDLQGLHTLPELAEVKSVIARATRPTGTVVLNADDPLVATMARHVRAPVTYFSLRPDSARVRHHLAGGGRAILLADGWLVEAIDGRRHPIVAAADIPATFGGAARHNIANALAAAGGAIALGATLDQVAGGLRTFRPTADKMPGRLNMYRLGRRVVIIDFAHNPAGLEVLLDMAEALIGRRGRRAATLSAVIGGAGDRPDDALHTVGRLAGQRSDQVAIKETLHYLRGRTRQSMLGELYTGLAEGGVRRADVPVYQDEPSAVRGELTTEGRLAALDDGRPHWLVVMCHEDRPGVAAVLNELGAMPVSDPSEIAGIRQIGRG